jgi:SAM-dependent methyltransferase
MGVGEAVVRALGRGRRLGSGGLRRVAERAQERRFGIETSEFVYLEDLGLSPEGRIWHDPSDFVALRRALKRLDVTEDDVFADLGSGLGRAVVVAATLPFRRVIGVELSPEMTERARANVERARPRLRARSIELVVADAMVWPVPPDLTVAYLYCPFTGEIFDGVVKSLAASVDQNPRPLRIVYNYPVEHARLLATGRVRVLDVASARWPPASLVGPHVMVTYLVLPSDEKLRREYVARWPQRLAGADAWLGPHEPGYQLEKPERLGGVVLDRPADVTSR